MPKQFRQVIRWRLTALLVCNFCQETIISMVFTMLCLKNIEQLPSPQFTPSLEYVSVSHPEIL